VTEFLRLTIYGIPVAAIYFVAASGLVVTYQTSGIFNFAHGAIGMVAAFVYWELRVQHHWPAPLALFVVIVVLAPLFGALIERTLIRRLRGATLATTLVVTIALLALLIGVAQKIWPPESRYLPGFFAGNTFDVLDVSVSWHQAIIVMVAAVVSLVLWLFLRFTRTGIAMRAVVDDRDLAALNGVRPGRVASLSWMIGCMLAAVSGILLASVIPLDIIPLTLLVINAYAAAMVGRLRSLPLTLVGALILGLLSQYVPTYVPKLFAHDTLPNWLGGLNEALPVLMLFVVLLLLPEAKARAGRVNVGARLRVPSLRSSLIGAALLIIGAGFASQLLSSILLPKFATAIALGVIILSLVPLIGWAGQVSLCPYAFAGIGAYAMSRWGGGGSVVGVIAAILLTAAVGALVALPALRLRGLYLALITLAFGVLAETMIFRQAYFFPQGSITVHPLDVGFDHLDLGITRFNSSEIYFVVLAVAYAIVAVLLLAMRRGPFGRRLAAMRDSPAACATLGLNLTSTKLEVFALSAAIGGLGGALLGGQQVSVAADFFSMAAGLTIVLLCVIGGVATVTGALFASVLFAYLQILANDHSWVSWVVVVAPAAGAIALAQNPDGSVADIANRYRAFVARLRARGAGVDARVTDPLARLDDLPLGAALDSDQARALDRVLDIEEVDCLAAAEH
jgi:branched-chain amino acid transport system permease protein